MRKLAHKQQYSFAAGQEAEKYEIFLRDHLLELHPNFYGVASKRKIETKDGTMYVVQLSTAIEDPNLESAAECRINGQNIYLWRDRCWATAVDKDNNPICRYIIDGTVVEHSSEAVWTETFLSRYQNKIVVIYPVGVDQSDIIM